MRAGRIAAFVTFLLASWGMTGARPAAAAPPAERLAGGDAPTTSVAVSRAGWASADQVVVANASGWSDVLAASALGSPILLTGRDSLPDVVAGEISRLHPSKAVVAGGTSVVGPGVRSRLRSMGLSLVEVGGRDRYETAAQVANLVPRGPDAILASGEAWADSASIAPWAAATHTPVLLTTRDALSPWAGRVREGQRTIVVGGTAVVSDAVASSVPNPLRLAGPDRFATSSAVAQWSTGQGVGASRPVLLPATSPAEALVGGVLAGQRRSFGLMAAGREPIEPQKTLVRMAASVGGVSVVGTPWQVSDWALNDALEALQSAPLVDWTNNLRRSRGLPALARDWNADERALSQAVAMATSARLYHQAPACSWWGEAVGVGEPANVFNAWVRSPEHYAVLTKQNVRIIGTAVITADNGNHWVSLVECG